MRLFHHMFSLMECSAPVLLARHFSILSATCYEVRMYEHLGRRKKALAYTHQVPRDEERVLAVLEHDGDDFSPVFVFGRLDLLA
jgi:hypothetical protein